MGIGEVAALSAAFLWTCSSLLWSRIHLSALTLNLFKNWIGVLLALIPILSAFLIHGESAQVAPLQSWIWLGLSGFIGIVAGDTFFFRSLQIIGPRLALMVATLAPLFSVVFSGLMLREYLGLISLSGVLLTIVGVFLVISERNVQSESPGLRPGRFRHGILLGIGAAGCQALGGVLSKMGMLSPDGSERCSASDATLIRLLVSALACAIAFGFTRDWKSNIRQGFMPRMLKLLVPATALGTWLGIWLSQVAFQKSNVAIAQTLLATCPLFAILVLWFSQGKKATRTSIVGTAIALVGIYYAVRSS